MMMHLADRGTELTNRATGRFCPLFCCHKHDNVKQNLSDSCYWTTLSLACSAKSYKIRVWRRSAHRQAIELIPIGIVKH